MTNAKVGDVVKVAGSGGIYVVTKIVVIGGERVYSVMNEQGLTIKVASDMIYKTAHSVESVMGPEAAKGLMESLEIEVTPIAAKVRPKRPDDKPFDTEYGHNIEVEPWVDDLIRQMQIDTLLDRLSKQISEGRAASSIARTKRLLAKVVAEPVEKT